jgi:hypothetical protein
MSYIWLTVKGELAYSRRARTQVTVSNQAGAQLVKKTAVRVVHILVYIGST